MDVLKKAFLAGLGAVSISQERTREIVEELVKAGKLKEKEGEKIYRELMAKALAAKKDVEGKVSHEVIGALGRLNTAAMEQMKKLEKRINDLEKAHSPAKKPAGAKKKSGKR